MKSSKTTLSVGPVKTRDKKYRQVILDTNAGPDGNLPLERTGATPNGDQPALRKPIRLSVISYDTG